MAELAMRERNLAYAAGVLTRNCIFLTDGEGMLETDGQWMTAWSDLPRGGNQTGFLYAILLSLKMKSN